MNRSLEIAMTEALEAIRGALAEVLDDGEIDEHSRETLSRMYRALSVCTAVAATPEALLEEEEEE